MDKELDYMVFKEKGIRWTKNRTTWFMKKMSYLMRSFNGSNTEETNSSKLCV